MIAVQAMKSGAQDYLVKGNMTPQTLRLAIHNVVERAHLLAVRTKSGFALPLRICWILLAYTRAFVTTLTGL